jgi:putative ABC transport system permease protein
MQRLERLPAVVRERDPMLSLYRTLSLRYLAKRWFRAVLIIASIALGVSTLVATRALTETMHRAGLQASNPLAGTADLVVTGSGGGPMDRRLDQTLRSVDGVATAHPRIFAKVKLPELDNRSALLVGIDVRAEDTKNQPWKITWRNNMTLDLSRLDFSKLNLFQMNPFNLDPSKIDVVVKLGLSAEEWQALLTGRAVVGLLGKDLAESMPVGTKMVEVQPPGTVKTFKVIPLGTVDAEAPYAALGGNTLILELWSANYLLGLTDKAHRFDLVLKPGAERDQVREAVSKKLQGRAEVHTPEESNEMIQNIFAGMQTGFTLCGVAALVVGLFLVYNVLAFSVAERRHEIGILLSLGATRRQIRWLFSGEAAVLGLAGSLLGIPVGLGLAYLGLQPVQDVLRDIFMELHTRQVDVSPQVLALAVAAGILTAVAAALIPAVTASAENPAEAVRRIPPRPTWRKELLQVSVSVLFVLLGTSCMLLRETLPFRLGTFGGLVFVLLGALVITPLLATALAAVVQPFFRQLSGIEGRLAADNLVRSAGRTGIVIAALAAGVCLVMQTAGIIRSNQQGIQDWLEDSITADLFVTAGSPVGAGIQSDPLSGNLAHELNKIPGVERVVPVSSTRHTFGDKMRIALRALDAETMYRMEQPRGHGNRLFEQLEQQTDAVIISENFGVLHHVAPGDYIILNSPAHGPVQLHVIGTMIDYSWNNGSVIMNRRDYVRHWKDDTVEFFYVFLKDKSDAAHVRETIIKKLGAGHGLMVQTGKEVLDYTSNKIDRIYRISYGQLIVVMCVAALGVVTALLISVLQRRREMGLLRAIGASRFQVVRSVLAEAALMGVIGTIIGLMIGVPMEWYGLNVIMREEFGYQFTLLIPWAESLLIAAAAVALATAAGLGPALYAVRQRIPEAIAYE